MSDGTTDVVGRRTTDGGDDNGITPSIHRTFDTSTDTSDDTLSDETTPVGANDGGV